MHCEVRCNQQLDFDHPEFWNKQLCSLQRESTSNVKSVNTFTLCTQSLQFLEMSIECYYFEWVIATLFGQLPS